MAGTKNISPSRSQQEMESILKAVKTIDELREQFEKAGCAEAKEYFANLAVNVSGLICRGVAEWAIDALAEGGDRLALARLLEARIGGVPDNIAESFALALRRVDYGDHDPLLEPRHASNKVRFTQRQQQLAVLSRIEFEQGRGRRRGDAEAVALAAQGIRVEDNKKTLRDWRKSLRLRFGQRCVENALALSKICGMLCRQQQVATVIEALAEAFAKELHVLAPDTVQPKKAARLRRQ